MKRLGFSIAVATALRSRAEAEQHHAVQWAVLQRRRTDGRTLAYLRRDLPPRLAVEMINEREVACNARSTNRTKESCHDTR